MNPSFEKGLGECAVLIRSMQRTSGDAMSDEEREALNKTSAKIWAVDLGRAKKGEQERTFACPDPGVLYARLGLTQAHRDLLADAEVSLRITQSIDEPNLRVGSVTAKWAPGVVVQDSVRETLFVFDAYRPGAMDDSGYGPLSVLGAPSGNLDIRAGSPEHADIDALADCFLEPSAS